MNGWGTGSLEVGVDGSCRFLMALCMARLFFCSVQPKLGVVSRYNAFFANKKGFQQNKGKLCRKNCVSFTHKMFLCIRKPPT